MLCLPFSNTFLSACDIHAAKNVLAAAQSLVDDLDSNVGGEPRLLAVLGRLSLLPPVQGCSGRRLPVCCGSIRAVPGLFDAPGIGTATFNTQGAGTKSK